MTHTPLSLARLAGDHLRERGIENARLEAELLLAAVLQIERLDLYLQFERPLTRDEVDEFRELVRRRLRREPLQYILGRAYFRELELHVDPRVLIPRPETEVLVGAVLEWSRGRGEGGRKVSALDIGTGSGAIILSLAHEGEFDRLVGSDISAEALEVARSNAERNGLGSEVEFREGALWSAVAEGERFDVVVSNPPYIAESERAELEPEVGEWEPNTALFAPDHGLAVIAGLIEGAPSHLEPGGLLALEIGAEQGDAVVDLIRQSGAYQEARVLQDLADRDRVVLTNLAD